MYQTFVRELCALREVARIDYVVVNAGILKYPNVRAAPCHQTLDPISRASCEPILIPTESHCCVPHTFSMISQRAKQPSTYQDFELHLRTNTIGPIIVAQKLLQTHLSLGIIIFMSSDSGSAIHFRGFEDG